jgi:hypothetical protein
MPKKEDDEREEISRAIELADSGEKLSPEEVAALETALEVEPLDLDSRIQLIGYYRSARFQSRDLRIARVKHVAWMIDNRPEHRMAGMHNMDMHRGIDRLRDYIDIRCRWLKQIVSNQDNVQVLSNAADFFFIEEKATAERCLAQCKALEPQNYKWCERLRQLYQQWGTAYELQALHEGEQCVELFQKRERRLEVLWKLPELAFDAGEIGKAERYANQVFELAERNRKHFAYGLAVQSAHITLGRLALMRDDVAQATEHLLQSLPSKEEAQQVYMNQPDAKLAAELFYVIPRESILKWIDLCSSFIRVEEWRTKVKRGESPWDFKLDQKHRYFGLSRLPRTAFDKGDWTQASQAIEEYFKIAKNYRGDRRHYGFGMHTAHVVLGQLALRSNDIEAAKARLMKAGQVEAAERLAEQGPDMALAMDLLKLGEKEAVLQFLKHCKRLWGDSPDSGLLSEWTTDVTAGKIPADWVSLYS